MGISPSSFQIPRWLTHKSKIKCPNCSQVCAKFVKLHKPVPNENPHYICMPCQDALYKKSKPKCPVCLRPCLAFTITDYFICYSCRRTRTQ